MHKEVEAAFIAAARLTVEGLGVEFAAGNRLYRADPPAPWVRAVYAPQAADNAALGGRRIRVDAIMGFEVYTPSGTGDERGLEVCDAILADFDNRQLQTTSGLVVTLVAGVVTRPGVTRSAEQFIAHGVGFPAHWTRTPSRQP